MQWYTEKTRTTTSPLLRHSSPLHPSRSPPHLARPQLCTSQLRQRAEEEPPGGAGGGSGGTRRRGSSSPATQMEEGPRGFGGHPAPSPSTPPHSSREGAGRLKLPRLATALSRNSSTFIFPIFKKNNLSIYNYLTLS